jgi:hypothetical protein
VQGLTLKIFNTFLIHRFKECEGARISKGPKERSKSTVIGSHGDTHHRSNTLACDHFGGNQGRSVKSQDSQRTRV